MAKKSTQLIIKHHQPFKFWFLLILYSSIAGAAGWFLYSYAQIQAGYQNTELEKELSGLVEHIQKVEKDNAQLREQVAVNERNRQVEKEAYSAVDSNLKDLQEEILELKEEVAFYRGIVSPAESAPGLNIQSFKVQKTPQENVYRYKLVLTQIMTKNRVVKGKVDLLLEGLEDGKPKKLPLKAVSGESKPNTKLRFKYFQTLEGNLILPKGFVPSRVFVEVLPRGKNLVKLKEAFDWKASLN
jgi:hypothetical protein